MKKFGFTLAEVLITLGIIGVVAALTAPALVMQSRNEQNGAKLAVAVSNLENAFTTAITQENADSLYQTKMWSGNSYTTGTGDNSDSINSTVVAKFAGQLGQYIHINGFKAQTFQEFYGGKSGDGKNTYDSDSMSNGPYYLADNGTKGTPYTSQVTAFPIMLKSGAVVFFQLYKSVDSDKDKIINKGGSLYNAAGTVYIDVNGKLAPNTLGRDIFIFYLGSNGILYPNGGVDVSIYKKGNTDNTWSTSKENFYKCKDGSLNSGAGCAARVIEEGYKITY